MTTIPTSDMSKFREHLNSPNKSFDGANTSSVKVVRMKKNLVISFSRDASGCGHIRNIFPLTYINAVYGKPDILRTCFLPFFYFNHDMLLQARTLFFPRAMGSDYLANIKRYRDMKKRYGYRLVYDIDDFVWYNDDEETENIPKYNFSSDKIPRPVIDSIREIMECMDTIIVSTDFLKSYISSKMKLSNVVVLPNCVPKYFVGPNKRPKITNRIKKPTVICTASPTHWNNKKKLKGDWETPWYEWVVKNVMDDKINFICMGANKGEGPWFFENIKNKITLQNWVNSYQYYLPILEHQPHFSIAPLIPNYFNYSKSDLKMAEASAYGAVFVGTTFNNGMPSPYDNCPLTVKNDCSVEDIQNIFDRYCDPEEYNSMIDFQYDWMNKEGRWLESKAYLDRLCKIF